MQHNSDLPRGLSLYNLYFQSKDSKFERLTLVYEKLKQDAKVDIIVNIDAQ